MRSAPFIGVLMLACKGSSETPAAEDAGPEIGVESCYEAAQNDGAALIKATAPYAQYVNPFIGTGGVGFGVGSTFPGPSRPYGMVRPGPDTLGTGGAASTFEHCAGYAYGDGAITAFSQTRMHGTGIVDYGTLGAMPTLGMSVDKTADKTRRTAFDKKSEKVPQRCRRERRGRRGARAAERHHHRRRRRGRRGEERSVESHVLQTQEQLEKGGALTIEVSP